MSDRDVTQLRIGNHAVGIMGLEEAIEEIAATGAHKSDEEIADALLESLSVKNYIPPGARESYGQAFFRAFKKHLGQALDDDFSDILLIRVLGQGCSQCGQLEQNVMEVLSELDLPADLEHVRDFQEISKYGVMGTPALLINGKVMCVGRVPPKLRIKEWLANEIKGFSIAQRLDGTID